jgi:hypothetical protein
MIDGTSMTNGFVASSGIVASFGTHSLLRIPDSERSTHAAPALHLS